MKLSVYNIFTASIIRGEMTGSLMKLTVFKTKAEHVEYNPILIENIIPKLDWPTMFLTAQEVGYTDGIPSEQPTSISGNDDLLRKLHHLLFEIIVVEGALKGQRCGVFIRNGHRAESFISNEDEY